MTSFSSSQALYAYLQTSFIPRSFSLNDAKEILQNFETKDIRTYLETNCYKDHYFRSDMISRVNMKNGKCLVFLALKNAKGEQNCFGLIKFYKDEQGGLCYECQTIEGDVLTGKLTELYSFLSDRVQFEGFLEKLFTQGEMGSALKLIENHSVAGFKTDKKAPQPIGAIYYEMTTGKEWQEKKIELLRGVTENTGPFLITKSILALFKEISLYQEALYTKLKSKFDNYCPDALWADLIPNFNEAYFLFPNYSGSFPKPVTPTSIRSKPLALTKTPPMQELKVKLEEWYQTTDELWREQKFGEAAFFVSEVIEALPRAESLEWDLAIEPLTVAEAIQQLVGIGCDSLMRLQIKGRKNSLPVLILLYQGYALCHRLMARVPQLCFDKYGVPSILNDLHFSCLVTAKEYQQIARLRDYFNLVNQKKPIALDLSEYLDKGGNWERPAKFNPASGSNHHPSPHASYVCSLFNKDIKEAEVTLKEKLSKGDSTPQIRGYRLLAYFTLFASPWHENSEPTTLPYAHSTGMRDLTYREGFSASSPPPVKETRLPLLLLHDRLIPIEDPGMKVISDISTFPRFKDSEFQVRRGVRRYSENEVFLKKWQGPLGTLTYRQLVRIRVHKETQMERAIEWCEEHLPLLDNGDVLSYLEAIFLEAGLLFDTKKAAPFLYEKIQLFFKAMIFRYKGQTSKANAALLWMRCAAALQLISPKETTALLNELSMRAWMIKESLAAISLYLVALGSLEAKEMAEHWMAWVEASVKGTLFPDWVVDLARKQIYGLRDKIQLDGKWEGSFPHYIQKETQLKLDLLEGRITCNGLNLTDTWPSHVASHPDVKATIPSPLPPIYYDERNPLLIETQDRQILIENFGSGITIWKNLPGYGRAEYIPFQSVAGHLQFWWLKKASASVCGVFTDTKGKVYATMDCSQQIHQENLLRIPLKAVPERIKFLIRSILGDEGEKIAWVFAKENEPISSIDLISLNLRLSFENNQMVCSDPLLKGYFAVNSIPATKSVPQALVFKNRAGSLKVMLLDPKRKTRYLYLVDSTERNLHPTSISGRLFLMKHYMESLRHEALLRCFDGLNPLSPYSETEKELLNELLSARGGAISLKIAARTLRDEADLKLQNIQYREAKTSIACFDSLYLTYGRCKRELTDEERALLIPHFLKLDLSDRDKEALWEEKDKLNPVLPTKVQKKQMTSNNVLPEEYIQPLKSFLETYFTAVKASSTRASFQFTKPQKGVSPLVEKLYTDLKTGFETEAQAPTISYELKQGHTEAFREALQDFCSKETETVKQERERLQQTLKGKKEGGRRFKVEDMWLFPAPDLIPFMLRICRLAQAREALNLALENRWDEAVETSAKTRNYNPYLYPSLLVYELQSYKFLRPNQSDILTWGFDMLKKSEFKQILAEFRAGGGKTGVLAPNLMAEILLMGLFPIFVSLPELSKTTQEDLREAATEVLKTRIKPLHIGLKDPTSPKALYEALVHWNEMRYVGEMTPQTLHALILQYPLAQAHRKEEDVLWLGKIKEFFETKVVFILDEVHRNADALWQAIIASGKPIYLEPNEQKLYLAVYQFLIKDPRAQLQNNQQAQMPPETQREVLSDLLSYLLNYLNIPEERKEEVKAYWSDLSVIEIKPLENQHLVDLTRGLLHFILPTTLKMVGAMDYGGAQIEGNHIAAPRKNKTPTLSQYENPEMAATLTAQHLYQAGLTPSQMSALVRKMIEEHELYLKNWSAPNLSPPKRQFESWSPLLAFEEISSNDKGQMEMLAKAIGKNPAVVATFLLQLALPQIHYYPKKYTSTYADLIDGAFKTFAFSATVGPPEQYLYQKGYEEAYRGDLAFQANTLHVACLPHNGKIHWVTDRQMDAYFTESEGLIDFDGWTSEFSTTEFAEDFMKKDLPFDGIQFMDDKTGKITVLVKSGKRQSVGGE